MVWGAPRGVDDIARDLAANLPSLTSLCLLRQRRLNEADTAALCTALKSNGTLRELVVISHAVSPGMAAHFSDALTANTSLQRLALGDRTFGDESLLALCPGIGASTSLSHLDLSHKAITHASASALASALAQSSSVTSLSLAHTPLGAAGLAALSSGVGSLAQLDLSGSAPDAASGRALATLVAACPALGSLCADDCPGLAEGAPELAAALAEVPALRRLSLARCSVDGALCAAAFAGASAALETLDLAGNARLGEEGALAGLTQALAEGRLPALSRLGLARCGLQPEAVRKLGGALAARAGPELVLDLSGSRLDEAAAAALAGVATLAKLNLHDCDLGDEVFQALLGEGLGSVRDLDLSGNRISLAALCGMLGRLADEAESFLPGLQHLILAANPGSDVEIGDGAAGDDGGAFGGASKRVAEARPRLIVVRSATDAGEMDRIKGAQAPPK